jgi:hypothetical protein
MDGRQPITPEAARWSCASKNADDPDSPITQWHYDAFFKQIIIAAIVSGEDIGIEQIMEDAFRVVASNPVGRVPSYRLLIEIGKYVPWGRDRCGCCQNGITIFGETSFHRNNGFQRFQNSSWGINFDSDDNDSNFIQTTMNLLSMGSGQGDLEIGSLMKVSTHVIRLNRCVNVPLSQPFYAHSVELSSAITVLLSKLRHHKFFN